MSRMKPIAVGILPQRQMRQRLLAIARGDYKPGPGEPKIWFTSTQSLSEVLSNDQHVLRREWGAAPRIVESHPTAYSGSKFNFHSKL